MEAEQVLVALWALVDPVLARAEDVVRSTARAEPLAAFLAGVVAVLLRARILVFGAVMLAIVLIAISLGYLPEEPFWLMPGAAVFLVIGLVQGVAVMLLGEDGASSLLAFLLVGTLTVFAFLLWRAPRGLLVRLIRRRA